MGQEARSVKVAVVTVAKGQLEARSSQYSTELQQHIPLFTRSNDIDPQTELNFHSADRMQREAEGLHTFPSNHDILPIATILFHELVAEARTHVALLWRRSKRLVVVQQWNLSEEGK